MELDGGAGLDGGADLDTHDDPGSGTWPRRLARAAGWTVAVVAVPVGLVFTLVAQWVANCELGFFGVTGPTESAARYRVDDGALFAVGLAIAVGPMLVIAWRNPYTERRRAARVTIVVVAALLLLIQLPQVADPLGFWEGTCS